MTYHKQDKRVTVPKERCNQCGASIISFAVIYRGKKYCCHTCATKGMVWPPPDTADA